MKESELQEAVDCLLNEHVDKDFEHRDVVEWTCKMLLAYFNEEVKNNGVSVDTR